LAGATMPIPDSQRRYVWTPNQVTLLIDSLIRGCRSERCFYGRSIIKSLRAFGPATRPEIGQGRYMRRAPPAVSLFDRTVGRV